MTTTHRLWLDRDFGTYENFTGTIRWYLDAAAELCEGQADGDREEDAFLGQQAETVRVILGRPVDAFARFQSHPVVVTDDELQAVKDVAEYASDYWSLCNYAGDSDTDSDILLGQLSDAYGNHGEPSATITLLADHTVFGNGLDKGPMWPIWHDVFAGLVESKAPAHTDQGKAP